MSKFAVVDASGLIENLIELDDDAQWLRPEGFTLVLVENNELNIGGRYLDGAYTPPPEPIIAAVVPQSISRRQFFQQLAIEGIISQDEALASNAAVIPAPLLAIINDLPEDQQFAAKMLVAGATAFERQHPMTEVVRLKYGCSPDQTDQFFLRASQL